VIQALDVETIYEVPLLLEKEGLDTIVVERLKLPCTAPDLRDWAQLVEKCKNPRQNICVALVGKYVVLADAYLSVAESLRHAGIHHQTQIVIRWIYSADLTPENVAAKLAGVDAVLVPGGFGDRGIEGKIAAIRYARENGLPFLGLCLGMQLAVVEYARNVCHLPGANSAEFEADALYPVIDLLPEQKHVEEKGGTMRLGSYPCLLLPGSKAEAAYGERIIQERHRHRFEFNNDFRQVMEAAGMVFSGISPDGRLVEIVEIKDHPWFVACQFHPEFKSRPNRPHPLFRDFVGNAVRLKNQFKQDRAISWPQLGIATSAFTKTC
jgi:CTP synthase